MPKFKNEKFYFCDERERQNSDELSFSLDINISAGGMFYTQLPDDLIEKFQTVGVDVGGYNRRRTGKGYFEEKTFDELKAKIVSLGKEYVSKEVISEVVKIEYSIETTCEYAKDEHGIYPNGYGVKDEAVDYWRSGTIVRRGNDAQEYGLKIYARPFMERIYQYKSGKTFTKKLYHPSDVGELGENGQFLMNVIFQKRPYDGKLREIEYTEEIAGIFANFFMTLFQLNEKIKDFLDPDAIRVLAGSGQLLLGGK